MMVINEASVCWCWIVPCSNGGRWVAAPHRVLFAVDGSSGYGHEQRPHVRPAALERAFWEVLHFMVLCSSQARNSACFLSIRYCQAGDMIVTSMPAGLSS